VPEAVRDDLLRTATFQLRASEDGSGDGLTIDGYAAVYDTPTRIDSWEGTFDEQIAFGAFRKSISERMPKLQFDHGYHPLIGSIPIGRWTDLSEERGLGLHTVGRLHDNWLVEPVRDAIAEESIDRHVVPVLRRPRGVARHRREARQAGGSGPAAVGAG
jgi:phage head maturation protease